MESSIIIYQTDDGGTAIETRLEGETVWLSQVQIAELYQKGRTTISEHITHIFEEGELDEEVVCRNFRHTTSHGAIEGKTQEREVKYYNLDMIIAIGYRVRSLQGTKFRQWATARLKEYIVKGFTMNDDLLKQAGGGNYFDELLGRIRDIRSSEKVFWRKVLDIYSTSVDYDPKAEVSQLFFKTVQNKMHWAAHGNTAAELIYKRIDADQAHLGLTNFKGVSPTKQEIHTAKNYLSEEELNVLNRVVTAYLELAELQALNRKPMYMTNWTTRLDEFIRMTGNEVLEHAGVVSHNQMLDKANAEYAKYKEMIKNDLSKVERDFVQFIDQTGKVLEHKKKTK